MEFSAGLLRNNNEETGRFEDGCSGNLFEHRHNLLDRELRSGHDLPSLSKGE